MALQKSLCELALNIILKYICRHDRQLLPVIIKQMESH
jgi:hypothetical protein